MRSYGVFNKINLNRNGYMPKDELQTILDQEYAYGFSSDLQQELAPQGLNEDIIRLISQQKSEPVWLLEWRLKAYKNWLKMTEPHWANVQYDSIDYQKIIYFARPKPKLNSLDEVDPEIRQIFDKLGIPVAEQEKLSNVAVDAILDSVSVATTFAKKLEGLGVIFCPISEAVQKYPELIQIYLGSVVPPTDNFFACLNAAVFTDGTFAYIPKGARCPMELSTYFRINAAGTGQFERTLIIAEDNSFVSYLEGCTAPMRDENQLHAAVVELVALEQVEIKYSTVQNWYPGNKQGQGGIYNFVTKRGLCAGKKSKISWTQVETGSAITWKYPSVFLKGEESVGEFYSITVTNNYQQADTGTKMVHLAPRTKSRIISKSICAGHSKNTYRGLVKIAPKAEGSKNYSKCDSLIINLEAQAFTYPDLENSTERAEIEHEASTSKISEEIMFYLQQRGLSEEQSVEMLVNGFCKEILQKLPMEFAVEAQKLLGISLEGGVG